MSVTLVVDALALARLTRLVTKDTITEPLRDEWVAEAYERSGRDLPPFPDLDPDPPKMAAFITCPWCTSVWLAAGVVAARRLVPSLWDPVARLLAGSQIAGFIANLDVDL